MLGGLTIYLAGHRLLRPDGRAAPPAPAQTLPEHRLLVLAGVLLAVVVFRGAYEQAGNAISLWTASSVERHMASHLEIPMTWFQSLNPLFVLAFAPVLVAARSRKPNSAAESPILGMAWGAAITAGAFAALALVAALSSGGQTHWMWLVAFFALYTWGELHILPTGLALFGRLAPAGYAATAIAVWYGASFAGNLFAGGVGALWGRLAPAGFFALMAGLALAAAAGLALLARVVRRPLS